MGTYSVELSTVTRTELYARARQLGVPGRSRMNKEELAWAVRERDQPAVLARTRRRPLWPWAATPAVFRTLAWRSVRMVPSFAGVMLSAAIGATTAMLLVDSPGELGAALRADLSTAYAQPSFAQPRPLARAASAPARDGVPSSRGAAPTIVLAEASGDSSSGMPSASQPAGKGTEAPPGDSGPTPPGPQAGDGDEPGSESGVPDGSRGDPGEGAGPGEEGGSPHGPGSDGGVDEPGKGKGKGKDKGSDKGKGKAEETGADTGRDSGHDKGKDGDKGKGKDGAQAEG